MLGDAYLKFAVRRHLFFAHPEQHEGWLTATFDTTVSNDALYARALERGLQGFLLTRAFDLRNWHAAGRAPPRGKPKREKKKRVPRYKKWQKMREEAAAARARAAGSETTSGVPKVGEKDEVGDTAASDIKAKNDEKGDSAASEKAAEDNERKRKYGAEERQEKESETKKRKEGSVEETARVVTNDEGGETLLELGENKEKHDGKQFQAKGGMKAGAETQSLQAESDGGRDGKDNEKVPTAKLDDAAAARAQDETRGAAEDEARAARNEYEAAIEEAELSSEEEGEIEEEGSGSDEDADEENEEQGDPNEVENNEEEKNEEEENEEEENGEKEGAASTAYEAKFPVGMSSPKAKATGLETIPEDGTGETGERSVESANGGKSLANKATNPALIGAELSEKVEAEGEVRLVKQDGIENDSKEPASGSKASGSSQSGGGQGYGGARRAAVGRARLNSRQGFGGTAGKAAAGAAKAEEQREGFGDFILGGQASA